ncbi:hypothetical protein AAG906_018612 [Vitis piasezkii]
MDDAKKALTPMPTTGSLVHNDRTWHSNLTSNNIGTPYMCANPFFHSKMKHIAINFYFVWDKVASRELHISHVLSQDQLVDPHHTTFPTMPSPVNIQD